MSGAARLSTCGLTSVSSAQATIRTRRTAADGPGWIRANEGPYLAAATQIQPVDCQPAGQPRKTGVAVLVDQRQTSKLVPSIASSALLADLARARGTARPRTAAIPVSALARSRHRRRSRPAAARVRAHCAAKSRAVLARAVTRGTRAHPACALPERWNRPV